MKAVNGDDFRAWARGVVTDRLSGGIPGPFAFLQQPHAGDVFQKTRRAQNTRLRWKRWPDNLRPKSPVGSIRVPSRTTCPNSKTPAPDSSAGTPTTAEAVSCPAGAMTCSFFAPVSAARSGCSSPSTVPGVHQFAENLFRQSHGPDQVALPRLRVGIEQLAGAGDGFFIRGRRRSKNSESSPA